MPGNAYIVTLHDHCSEEEATKLKQEVKDQGGKITQEYSIIKAFAAEFPENHVSTLEAHPKVKALERDGEVKTQ